MKAVRDEENSREIIFFDIGQEGVLESLETRITYTGPTGVGNAAVLDRYVVPAIIDAVNAREHLRNKIFALETNLDTLRKRIAARGHRDSTNEAHLETVGLLEITAEMAISLEQMKVLCGETGISTESPSVVSDTHPV